MTQQMFPTQIERWWTLDETNRELPITAEDRIRITSEALKLWLHSPKAVVAYFVLMACCVATWFLTCWVVRLLASGLGYWVEAIGMAVLFPVFITGMWALKRWGYSRVLFSVLRTHGFNVCIKCGYWLHGLDTTSSCPECGWNREETKT